MAPLKIRAGLELLAIAVAMWFTDTHLLIGVLFGLNTITLFAFNVRVNKALTVAEDYRAALARMEHHQGEAMKDGMGKAKDAHDRWTQMMDQAEKQMSGGGSSIDDLMNELGIENDDDEEDDDE